MNRFGSRYAVSDRAALEIAAARAKDLEAAKSSSERHRELALNGAAAIVTLQERLDSVAGQLFEANDARVIAERERDALRTQLAEAQKDTQRLDRIEAALFARSWNGVIDSGSRYDWRIAADFRHTTQRMIGETFREAIDAALTPKEQAGC
jgi:hypothetical protein